MRHPIDQAGVRQIAEHRTLAVDFRALEIGSLVNIDHTTRFSRITFRQFQLEGLVKPAKRQFDPLAFLAKVGTGKTILKYRKGRIIYAQGEEADQIFYIQSGKVKVTVVSEQGKEAVVGLLEAGQFFGEGCLNGQASRIGTARAMEECLITSITRKAMLTMLRQEPRFSELFVTYLVTRSNRIEEDLIDQLFNSSEKRLARLLLLLANFAKDGKPIPIDASINQVRMGCNLSQSEQLLKYPELRLRICLQLCQPPTRFIPHQLVVQLPLLRHERQTHNLLG